MKILYIANHGCGYNDDEGAISHALTELGHQVIKAPQDAGRWAQHSSADLLLFHKWDDVSTLKEAEGRIVRAFWYFDLVSYPDPTIAGRCHARYDWMSRILPNVDVGFCTDGDWVESARSKLCVIGENSGKLNVLRQGADGRVVGRGVRLATKTRGSGVTPRSQLLFTGTRHSSAARADFVDEMVRTYGPRFAIVSEGVYGQYLANRVANIPIVVAPDSPVTDKYWSNRVYMALGFGAFMLHPYCGELAKEYDDGREIIFYHNRTELHRLIDFYLIRPGSRDEISEAGLARTISQHLYRHRCQVMLRVLGDKFGLR